MNPGLNRSPYLQADTLALGTALIVALTLGGGTRTSLWTDAIVQIVMILASVFVIVRQSNGHISRPIMILICTGAAIFVVQLFPGIGHIAIIFQGLMSGVDPELIQRSWLPPATLGLSRTLEVLLYFSSLALLLVAVSKIDARILLALFPFVFFGFAIQIVFAIADLAGDASPMKLLNVLPYRFPTGLVANGNHLATILFTSIPLAFAYFRATKRIGFLVLYLVFAMLALLAGGSLAGALLGFTVMGLCLYFSVMNNVGRRFRLPIFAVATAALGVVGYAVAVRIGAENFETGLGRPEFFRTTLVGIWDNLFFGIGLGNFKLGYPAYEDPHMIFNTIVNHAHNDYLELVFEGGLLAVAALVLYFVLFVQRVARIWRQPFAKELAVGIAVVLLHSAVDYPLRTLAVASLFVFMNGMLFHRAFSPRKRKISD
ncbi:MAG: O-antigen ligase family protein [Pseudomonadota bacterium]